MECKVLSVKCGAHCCASHTKELWTRYQTGWNVTKCHACHAKRHDNLLGNLRKGEVLQLPPYTQPRHRKTRDSRRDTWEHQKRAFRARLPPISQLETFEKERFCSFPHRHGENQQLETRHVGAAKRAFRARLPPVLTLCSPPSPSTLATQKNFTKGRASQEEAMSATQTQLMPSGIQDSL